MTKVQIKSEKLTPFGGLFLIMEQFDSTLSSVIDSTLGQRCKSFGLSSGLSLCQPSESGHLGGMCCISIPTTMLTQKYSRQILDNDCNLWV